MLRERGRATNARFLAALGEGQPGPPDATTLAEVVVPSQSADGLRAPNLRFGDPRVMALLALVAACAHAFEGITNAALRQRMTGLWQPRYSSAQASYDLARLCRNGLLARDPGANRPCGDANRASPAAAVEWPASGVREGQSFVLDLVAQTR